MKRTLFFENPAYLSLKQDQLLVTYPDAEMKEKRVAIEDLGIVLLEHPQITLTQALIAALMEQQVAVITCGKNHMPSGIMLPFEGHTLVADRYALQMEASLPLKKQLWQQTVRQKILNQAMVLAAIGQEDAPLKQMAVQVQSGDSGNIEGAAARYYWQQLLGGRMAKFTRDRDGEAPNNALNYIYAILRAAMCRALVGSGLLPALGIHHRNKYNAFALADDMMEPFRPVADAWVLKGLTTGFDFVELNRETKQYLWQILVVDVLIHAERSPLLIALQRVSAGLVACLEGSSRKMLLPTYLVFEQAE